jgi:hypothetical protein
MRTERFGTGRRGTIWPTISVAMFVPRAALPEGNFDVRKYR